MSTVKCQRCSQDREALEKAPMPSELGEKVKQVVCAVCWQEWMEMSTKIINEYRLQLFRPDHRQMLEEQLKQFLNFPA